MEVHQVSTFLSCGTPLTSSVKESIVLFIQNGERKRLEIRFYGGHFKVLYKHIHIGTIWWSSSTPWWTLNGQLLNLGEAMQRLTMLIGDGSGNILLT